MKVEFTPQAQRVGKPRNRLHRLQRGPSIEIARYPRTSRVIIGVDKFGNFVYIPLPRLNLYAHSLPRLHPGAEKLFDRAAERKAFTTAKKRKTTTGGFAVKDTGYRPKKWGGLGSPYERKRIAQIRRNNELKRKLLKAGIDEHKLFLLMHSAYHSQTLLEGKTPIRSLPHYKQGGFGASKEKEIMRKQRLRNQRLLASHGTIYRY